MLLQDFFSPIKADVCDFDHDYTGSQLGNCVTAFAEGKKFPTINADDFDIAIIGVMDDRNAIDNRGCALAPDFFRAQFYKLYKNDQEVKLLDLGNILPGKSLSDTYFALKETLVTLMKMNILPIIIGGSQDLSFAQYLAYGELEQKVNLLCLDAKFDLEDADENNPETTSQNFIHKIFTHQPNYLFNYSNLGYQTYLVSQESLRVIEKVYFDAHRLGDITANINAAEPIIRNANMISFDMGVIRSSDAFANANTSPNGFYGDDACKICRYAGMSDKLDSIGFFEFNPSLDKQQQSAKLLAQMVWYTVDGFYHRKADFPTMAKSDFYIYKTYIQEAEHELIFIKSKKTDRWWLQVPYPKGHFSNERYHWVPCEYEDYKLAVEGELPDIWWRTYQKLT